MASIVSAKAKVTVGLRRIILLVSISRKENFGMNLSSMANAWFSRGWGPQQGISFRKRLWELFYVLQWQYVWSGKEWIAVFLFGYKPCVHY